ncbi:MAG: hypothetical protein JST11_06870 [Acidobacteria bacterium]|nr:hypothetical protein [Acidobacteriota bacterium]
MWLNRFRKNAVPLTGAPAVRRLKTYSAASGFVYQYWYEGHRPLPGDGGVEFVFSAGADRKSYRQVSVRVEAAAVRAWEAAHARSLSGTERYALAKMALFTAFDERPTPAEMLSAPVYARTADIEAILERLGLE